MELYPVRLYPDIYINNEEEAKNISDFFGVKNIKIGKYTLFLFVLGDEEENWHQIIPIGKITEIALFVRNRFKYTKNIEGVLPFELSDGDYNNQRNQVISWFNNIKDKKHVGN